MAGSNAGRSSWEGQGGDGGGGGESGARGSVLEGDGASAGLRPGGAGSSGSLPPQSPGEQLAFVDLEGSPGRGAVPPTGTMGTTLPHLPLPASRDPWKLPEREKSGGGGAELPGRPPTGAPFGEAARASQAEAEGGGGIGGWVLRMARPYFDCETDDVLGRLVDPFRPWRRGAFLEEMGDAGSRGDLWGPVWLTLTNVLCLACVGNAVAALKEAERERHAPAQSGDEDDGFGRVRDSVDVRKVSVAFSVLFGFQVVAPALAALVLAWCGRGAAPGGGHPAAAAADDRVPPGIPHLVSLYGYSLSPLLAASAACLVPVASDALRWSALGMAAALGAAFCFQNLAHLTSKGATLTGLLLCALAPHVALCFAAKLLLL